MKQPLSLVIPLLGVIILINPKLDAQVSTPPADISASPVPATAPASQAGAAYAPIHNDFFCLDQNGARINTRSGCLRQFNGLFYWYGGTARFHDQTCYTSLDLVHWNYKGVVLHLDVDANRMEVLYNDATKQYVMFMKYDGNGAFLAIATSPVPEGPFTFQSKTLVDNARMGDMSVFKDTDGKAYLCYVSWATGTNAQHGIYLMSARLFDSGKAGVPLGHSPPRSAAPLQTQRHLLLRNFQDGRDSVFGH